MICRVCKIEKVMTDFPWVSKGNQQRAKRCKDCQKILGKKHYTKNVETYKTNAASRRQKYKDVNLPNIYNYLLNHPCVKCGEKEPIFLDFDHIVPSTKAWSISHMTKFCIKWETILKEIDKCQVLCVKCHRLKTAEENNWYQFKRYMETRIL